MIKKYDVIIGGAGVAGISAALYLARSGFKVALVEKTVLPGGLATSGLVNIFLPLCDGNGKQILFGLPEELLKISVNYSPTRLPQGWGKVPGEKISRYLTKFSPASFVLALDKIIEHENIDIWYDSLITDVEMDKNRIKGVYLHNKSGKLFLEGKVTIDATGDADIAKLAGAELIEGKNHLSIWALQASQEQAANAVKYNDSEMLLNMVRLGANDTGEGAPDKSKTPIGINGKSVTSSVLDSRKLLREYFDSKSNSESKNSPQASENKPHRGDSTKQPFPITLPTMPIFRTTRRIVGRETILNKNVNVKIKNSIADAPDWRRKGDIWQIPLGALLPEKIDGLFTAGRIISAEEGDAWGACRVIPVAALTGELAGKAAADAVISDAVMQ